MARTRIVTGAIDKRARIAGDYDTSEYQLPAGAKGIRVEVERDSWPTRSSGLGADEGANIREAEVARLYVEISLDNRQTWQPRCAIGMPGGVTFEPRDPDEEPPVMVPATHSFIEVGVPDSRGRRWVRARLRLRNGLNASVNIDSLD